MPSPYPTCGSPPQFPRQTIRVCHIPLQHRHRCAFSHRFQKIQEQLITHRSAPPGFILRFQLLACHKQRNLSRAGNRRRERSWTSSEKPEDRLEILLKSFEIFSIFRFCRHCILENQLCLLAANLLWVKRFCWKLQKTYPHFIYGHYKKLMLFSGFTQYNACRRNAPFTNILYRSPNQIVFLSEKYTAINTISCFFRAK